MNREQKLVRYLILFTALLSSAVLMGMSYNYWSIVDYFALPSADTDMLLVPDAASLFIFLFMKIADQIKFIVTDSLIFIGGYDLHLTFRYIVITVLVVAIVKYFYVPGVFELVSIFVCVLALIVSQTIASDVSKKKVDEAFIAYQSQKKLEFDYKKLLADRNFGKLDDALMKVETAFENGLLTVEEYGSHFEKFSRTTGDDLAILNEWVEGSKVPEIALLARASTFYYLGGEVRGTAFANKTSEEQFAGLRKYYDMAVVDINDSMKINEDILQAYVVLVNITGTSGSDSEAEDVFKKGRGKFPESYYLAYFYVDKLQPKWGGSLRHMRRAAKSYEASYKYNPLLVALKGLELVAMADSQYVDKNYHTAITLYNRALLYGLRRTVLDSVYYAYKEIQDYEAAVEIMTLCLDNFKSDANCFYKRAMAYAMVSDGDKAKLDIAKAVEIGLDYSWKYQNVGWMYETIKAYDQAVKYYMLASDMDNKNIYSLERLYVLSYYKYVALEQVLPYMKRWTEINPDEPDPWLKYADTLGDINPEESIPLYEKYLSLVDHSDKNNEVAIEKVLKLIAELSDKKI
ncbi:MAG TPA: DUF4034 domain-containing protein [Gammaproteobacteria bacterium]|nr:DUF4034 domain-containing protein [Gammaproteobacteria bacterium]